MSWLQIITSLARNWADIAFFVIVINRFHPYVTELNRKLQEVLLGGLFGIASILSMLTSISVTDGVMLDMKNVIVAMAGIYGGYRGGLVAAVIAGGYRYLLGGIGWEPSLWMIALCAALGVLCREWEQRRNLPPTVTSYLLFGEVIALVNLGFSLALPAYAADPLRYYSLPLLIIMPLAALSFRYFIQDWGKPLSTYTMDASLPKTDICSSIEQLQKHMNSSQKTAICIWQITNFQRMYPFSDDLMKGLLTRVKNMVPNCHVIPYRENEMICSLPVPESSEHLLSDANQILTMLCEPITIRNRTLHPAIHGGLAVQQGMEIAETLLQHAEIALRFTKEPGHPPITIYEEGLLQKQILHSKLEEGLAQALVNDQLDLHFQPQFHVQTGQVRGFEALLRWHHPELGMVSPAEFIPIAEENGTILPIGLWVLRRACLLHRELLMEPFPNAVISVNISALQLSGSNFPSLVSQILSETGLPPHLLELEITESMLIASISAANVRLQELTQIGVRIALDDFGTGYSSLHYLNRLPLHLVKLDKSFIRDICKNNEGRITESIIRLVQNLDIEVVAEGVESYDQLYLLKTWGCDIVQGFLLSKPLKQQELGAFINKQSPLVKASP